MNFSRPRNDVRREFSERIVGPGSRPRKLAHETVAAMMEDLSAGDWPEGHLIGSVSELRQRFGVGRKACQEAITIMQTRRLIDVRRGVGGGLYVSRPRLNDTTDALILYLALSHTPLHALRDARIIVCQLAVRSLIGGGGHFEYRDVQPIARQESKSAFYRQLARASGDQTIAFLMDLLDDVQQRYAAADHAKAAPSAEIYTEPPDNAFIQAIRSGDADTACRLVRNHVQPLDGFGVSQSMNQTSFVQTTTFLDLKKSSGRLAGMIVEEILSHGTEESFKLGSEWDIGARYGYAAEIVRPALRILEDLGIVACCRGRSGGVISTPPRIGAVVRLISSGVASRGISPAQNFELASKLVTEGVRLAAERNSGTPHSSTKDLPSKKIATLIDLIDIENALLDIMDNPILAIFVRSFALQSVFSKTLADMAQFSSNIASAMRSCSLEIAQAIQMGEPTAAVNAAERKCELMRREFEEVS
ncbi:FCD domain-containing protein [Burkholderia guangdongensis]|uniref:FCD domain-containing protein n=1 Tax=Burkholderia guangdongensis TaxID=1792500 RepID=UPI0015CD16C6|nr:FCD domain-containing protein [Burkholderia guangdongensis]